MEEMKKATIVLSNSWKNFIKIKGISEQYN
jgi:hypothetical protein